MIIYYRVSNNSYNKIKLEQASKEYCLDNFLSHFPDSKNKINIIADNVTEENLIKYLNGLPTDNIKIEYTSLNNAQSFKYIFDKALQEDPNQLIYFVEDDYLHLSGSQKCLEEGLERADYVTLYDHVDKYVNRVDGGDNPFIEDGGEITRVILTESTHWKLTNSTTMTFAAKVNTLKQDKHIWHKHLTTAHPNDFAAFLELRNMGRTLILPIPAKSTHCEIKYLSPLIDWSKI